MEKKRRSERREGGGGGRKRGNRPCVEKKKGGWKNLKEKQVAKQEREERKLLCKPSVFFSHFIFPPLLPRLILGVSDSKQSVLSFIGTQEDRAVFFLRLPPPPPSPTPSSLPVILLLCLEKRKKVWGGGKLL